MASFFKKHLREIREYLMISLGLLIYACAWKTMLLQHKMVGGGATGVAAIVEYATNGTVPMAVTYGGVNLILLLLAIKTLGLEFSIRTIWGVTCLTIWLAVLPTWDVPLVPLNDHFLACVVGGIMCGIGIGIVFLNNGSSGGTDIIAMIVNKYHRDVSLGRSLLYCDCVIIGSSYFLPTGDLTTIVYGLVLMTVSAYTVDVVVNGMRQSVQFLIFSQKYDLIANAIMTEVPRGVTVLDGTGWYSKQPMKVVCVLARKGESTKIFQIVKRIDPNAFVSQSEAAGVYGQGFNPMG